MCNGELVLLSLTWIWLTTRIPLTSTPRARETRQLQFLINLTWVWLTFNFQLEAKGWTTCAKPNSFFIKSTWVWLKFDTPQLATNTQEPMCKVKLIFLSLTWFHLKFSFEPKTQCKSANNKSSWFFLFDLDLTKLSFQLETKMQVRMCKVKLIFLSLTLV